MKKEEFEETTKREMDVPEPATDLEITDNIIRLIDKLIPGSAMGAIAVDQQSQYWHRVNDLLRKKTEALAKVPPTPEPPKFEGFEWTGEYREPKRGEWFYPDPMSIGNIGMAYINFNPVDPRYIYRKLAPAPEAEGHRAERRWRLSQAGTTWYLCYGGMMVAEILVEDGEQGVYLESILRAVNGHEELVKTLTSVQHFLVGLRHKYPSSDPTSELIEHRILQANKALAAAGGD